MRFAKFKLNNGWENNTLGDVECFWKQKQKQSMRNIPIPRFTQQDIIDKRSYIQASGAKHAKARRYRLLNRSLSNPSSKRDSLSCSLPTLFPSSSSITSHQAKKIRRKSHPSSQQYISNDEDIGDTSNSSEASSPPSQEQPLDHNQTYYFHHCDNPSKTMESVPSPTPIHSVSSFDASCVPTDLNGEPSVVRNSLDFLSYAIAMTEKNHKIETTTQDEEDTGQEWTRTSQLRLSLSIPSSQTEADESAPSSPSMNVAAQAMLMFVNRESSSL